MITMPARVSFARLSSQGFFSVELTGAGQPDGRGGRPVVDGCAMEDSSDRIVVEGGKEDSSDIGMIVVGSSVRVLFDSPDVG
jgi:hypothetical protein